MKISYIIAKKEIQINQVIPEQNVHKQRVYYAKTKIISSNYLNSD